VPTATAFGNGWGSDTNQPSAAPCGVATKAFIRNDWFIRNSRKDRHLSGYRRADGRHLQQTAENGWGSGTYPARAASCRAADEASICNASFIRNPSPRLIRGRGMPRPRFPHPPTQSTAPAAKKAPGFVQHLSVTPCLSITGERRVLARTLAHSSVTMRLSIQKTGGALIPTDPRQRVVEPLMRHLSVTICLSVTLVLLLFSTPSMRGR
jgi:hypothetical protein